MIKIVIAVFVVTLMAACGGSTREPAAPAASEPQPSNGTTESSRPAAPATPPTPENNGDVAAES